MSFRKWMTLLTVMLLVLPMALACGATEEPVPEPTEAPVVEPTEAEVEEPTEEPAPEPCAPATEGALAGVDPRGQTVVWWHQHSGSREEGLAEMIAEFNDTNECGITVEATNQGGYNDIRDKMNAGIATGELPGLVVGYQNDQAFYALADGLADIDPYLNDPTWGLTAEEKADFFSTFLQQSVHPAFGNQRLGFPPNRSVEGIYYNLTWLQELGFDGPPSTPEEFRDMACAAAEANGDGTGGYILRDDASGMAAWTFAFGGNVLSEDGTDYVYNGQATVDAMTFIKGMLDDGCAYFFTEGYPNPELAGRRAIFTQGSSSGLPFYASDIATVAEEKGTEPDEWGFTAIPHTTAEPTINIYGGDVMIPATTPETQLAAWIFVKWLTLPENQAQWVRISNYFPTRASTADFLGDYISENPQWGDAFNLLQYGVFEPQLISYQGVRDAAQQAFNEIMQGADIQGTLDNLTEEANTLQGELMEGIEPAPQPTPEPVTVTEPCAPATEGTLAGVDPQGVTVVWWHQHSGSREEGLAEMIAEFNDTNECGITVEATNQGGYNDIRDKMNAGIATGELPGLVVGYQNDQAFYALADGLADIDPYLNDPTWGLTAEEKADFFSTFLQQSVHPAFGNQRLGFPPNRSVEGIYYNLTWLQELGFDGPPSTPEEFRDMACAAAEANGDGTGGYILRDDASGMAAWTFAFGGNVLSEDGTDYVYNGQATVDAMTFIKGMLDDGCAYFFTEGYPNPELAGRRAIFTQGSSSGLPFYASDIATVAEEKGTEPDEWGFTAIPHTTAEPTINIYGGDVMIPATTPETQLAAWIFVKWLTLPENQAQWVRISNYFPTRASTADFLGDYISENPQWGDAFNLLQYGVFEPQLISYQGVRDAAQQAFNEIMQGADIQGTLDNLTEEANELQAELMEE